MKKILSVALSTAMAFSMFANVIFAADANLSDEQKFSALKEAGVMTGLPDGSSSLGKALTRAELAKIIVKAIDLQPVTGVASYKDKNYTANHWAAPFIEAATQAGIMNGKDATAKLFDPTGNVTVQELAKVLVTALKLEVPSDANNTADSWAKGYVAAAVEKGYLPAGINYQANATRSQAVVAAYAIYQARQVPTVKSYKVVDPKNVEFTMSDGEVVKVALEKALEANKETEVKFTYKNKEYNEKVVYKTTVAQKVESVKADNLKQIVVKFDGTVDPVTAEQESNYKIKDVEIDKAELSEDKTTVTLLLTEGSKKIENKVETKLEINGVKNEDGTVTFDTEIKFTPVDVTAPTVKEVVGLGTKAFKIKFSEPVDPEFAAVSSSYDIDGGKVGGSVTYSYPDTVIITANLSVGSHKVSVKDVADYSGLKIAPVEHSFEVVEDTQAPQIVSIKTNDLKELTIKFNETVKSVDDVYVNSSSNNAESIKVNDDEVKVTLEDPMNYTKNTVHVKGVRDYSDNKADREGEVTPTLDTVRPTVKDSELKKVDGDYKLTLTFSKKVLESDVRDLDNYVLKDNNGKIADTDYTNKDGHPTLDVELADNFDDKYKVIVNLGSDLDEDTVYNLEVKGIGDRAYVKNVMLPQTIKFDTSDVSDNALQNAWLTDDGKYVYLQFSTDLATSGNGSAVDKDKYTLIDPDGKRHTYDGTVNIYNSDSIRLRVADFDYNGTVTNKGFKIEAAYIFNQKGDLIKSKTGSAALLADIGDSESRFVLKAADSEVVSTKEVKLKFNSKVNSYTASSFRVTDGKSTKTPTSAETSADKKTLILKFTGSNELSKVGPYTLEVLRDGAASDSFGNKLYAKDYKNELMKDKIVPEVEKGYFTVGYPTTVTDVVYFDIQASEELSVNVDGAYPLAHVQSLFEIKDNADHKLSKDSITEVTYGDAAHTVLRLVVKLDQLEAQFGKDYNGRITIKFDGESAAITDASSEKNKLKNFTVHENFVPKK